jgi:hypothetical protein
MTMGHIADTTSVQGCRILTFASLEDLLDEAEWLATSQIRTLGRWSLGQILDHLATWMEFSIDGVPVRMPLALRLIVRPLRRWIIYRPMRPGFRWPQNADPRLVPQKPVSTHDGLEHLRHAIGRLRTEGHRASSPLLGRLSANEWEQLHLRHAEHHLSFVVPGADVAGDGGGA